MSDRITIDFTGLCVFVTNDAPEKLKVILADDPDNDPKTRMKHHPLLSMNVKNVARDCKCSFDQVIQLANGDQIASWRLEGCIVRLKGEEKMDPGNVVLWGMGTPKFECPQNAMSEMDLCWVPSLKRVSDVGKVKSIYLADKPSAGPEMAARVDFTRGYLYANAEVNRLSPIEAWTFPQPGGPGISQYLADTVRLELRPQPDATPAIEIAHFDGTVIQTIDLDGGDDPIEISITDLPEAMPDPKHEMTMPHFRFYYDLLDPPPVKRPIPERPGHSMPMSTSKRGKPDNAMTVPAFGVRPVRCTPGLVP